ncbi:MAG: preprotein translocase subunit SecG [Planctomycetota bacterium]
MAPFLTTLLYIVFVLSAIVLVVVILLQEGKGGGFGQFLGESGQQTFGVGAKGINTFTGYTAVIFLACALLLHWMNVQAGGGSLLDQFRTDQEIPFETRGPAVDRPLSTLPPGEEAPTPPSTGG